MLFASLVGVSPSLDAVDAVDAVERLDLLGLSSNDEGSALPAGWDLRPVRGCDEPVFVIAGADEPALSVSGRDAAAFAYRRLSDPLSPAGGRLSWSWRSLDLPDSADLREAGRDDSALRVYVVFGRASLRGSARAIFYSWGNHEPEALERPAFESARMHVVRVAGAGDADGAWRQKTVEPFADYRRIWGGEPEPITVVGVIQDTDATGDSAAAELRQLFWEPATR